MKLKRLKALIKDLPDDTDVLIDGCGVVAPAQWHVEDVIALDSDRSTFLIVGNNLAEHLRDVPTTEAVVMHIHDLFHDETEDEQEGTEE